MSDTLKQLKDIKGLLASIIAFIGSACIVGGFVLSLVIDAKVATAISSQDLGTDEKIVAMDTNIASNTRTGEENAEDIGQNRRNVEAAFRQLMGMPAVDSE